MRSIVITALIALLLIFPVASAATTIRVKTLPGHDVYISIWDQNFGHQITSPKKYLAGIDGEVEHVYDGTTSPFGVMVIVKLFESQKYREQFGPYTTTGGTIDLPDLLPDGYDPGDDESADTGVNNTNTNNTAAGINNTITNQTGNLTTGSQDKGQNISFKSIFASTAAIVIYCIIGGIILLAIIAAIIMVIVRKIRSSKPARYGMEPVSLNTKYRPPSGDKYLDNIEKEIDNVDRQIEQYKKRNLLEDAQRRLEEKKRVLEKIKRGENVDYSRNNNQDHKFKKRFY